MDLTKTIPILIFAFYLFQVGREFFVQTWKDQRTLSDRTTLVVNVLIATVLAYFGSRIPTIGIRLMTDITVFPMVFIVVVNGILPPVGYSLTKMLFGWLHRGVPAVARWHAIRPYLRYGGYLAGASMLHMFVVTMLVVVFRKN